MSNAWVTYPFDGDSLWKHRVIPDKLACVRGKSGKVLLNRERSGPRAIS